MKEGYYKRNSKNNIKAFFMANKWWKDRGYKTKKDLEDEIRKIINGTSFNSLIQNPAEKELLVWVLSHHHEYSSKTNYSNDFNLQMRSSQFKASNKELWIVFNEGYDPMDISWTTALKPNGQSNVKQNLSEAARQAINDQILSFKDQHKDFKCCLCNKEIEEKIEVCHYKPRFDELFKNYFGIDEASYTNFKVIDGSYAQRFFENQVQKDGWTQYHANHAILNAAHGKCIDQRSRK